MKVLPIIFSLLVSFGFSQGMDPSVFSLNGSTGINGCQIHGDSYSGYDKGGLFVGVAVNAKLNNRSSFDLGFYFSQKGARHNANPEKGDYTSYNLRLNYLDMPLLYRLQLNRRFYITMGPSIAYLISSKEEIDGPNATGETTFNKFELGINAGLGALIKNKFTLELRTSNSILPVHDYGVPSTVYYPNPIAQFFNQGLYNNILTLFVTYKINKH